MPACLHTATAAEPSVFDTRRKALEDAQYADLPEPVAEYRKVVHSTNVETYSRAALALRRWMIANDPHRPIYHFTGPESWINDPNGPIYHDGQYHLFYQFDPIVSDGNGGWRRSKRCWGHAVSKDLVHWVDWPVALWPDSPQDREGVYSGNTFIDRDGFPCALYTGNVAGHRETYGILARSTDGWITWQKKTVMDNRQRPNADSPVHWDGQVWREGARWCQLIGGTTGGNGRQGAAWLWTSTDLEDWTLQKNIAPSIKRGGYWELPYLIPLEDKHVLLVGNGNPYWVGKYDARQMLFTPDAAEPKSFDNGTYYSFNPNMVDDKRPGTGSDGDRRQLMHGWVTGPASPTKSVPYWQGAHSIPRVLTLRGQYVMQRPIPEIRSLRATHRQVGDVSVEPDKSGYLPNVKGDTLEIIARFAPVADSATRFGLKLRVPDGDGPCIRVWYDPKTEQFGIDGPVAKQASAFGGIIPGRAEDGPIALQIFLDRSIVEVYCGGGALTNRTFTDPKALAVDLFAEGGSVRLQSLDAWQMRSMWDQ